MSVKRHKAYLYIPEGNNDGPMLYPVVLAADYDKLLGALLHLAKSSSSMNMWIKDGIPAEVADYWEKSYDVALAICGNINK